MVNLSLSGEADFHAIVTAHDQIFAWDARTGALMVSADGAKWETRSTLELLGSAVDPANANRLIAATPDGVVGSNDGGRTWIASEGPRLIVISWDPSVGLWGAEASGRVHRSTTSGWELAGQLPGEPSALLATPDAVYAAAVDAAGATGIYQSNDEGRAWSLRYRDEIP